MLILNQQDSIFESLYGVQKYYYWKQYVVSPYVYEMNMENGKIFYNTMTSEILFLDTREINIFLSNSDNFFKQTLINKWFYVPNDLDMKSFVYLLRQQYSYHNDKKWSGKISRATILTTTECNAKCPYCYERGTKKHTMSQEIANDLSKYLVSHAKSSLKIRWFGGEPLVNASVINTICNNLKTSDVNYTSTMVSNCYLLDKHSDEEITELWKLKAIQITIDGTKNEYLKIKSLPNDAYETILNQIIRLANLNIKVAIRVHVTMDNVSDIEQLVIQLNNYLSVLDDKRNNVSIYLASLFDSDCTHTEKHNTQNIKIAEEIIRLNKIVAQVQTKKHSPGRTQTYHCMADDNTSLVFTPAGEISLCEHCHDREIIGNIYDTTIKLPTEWKEYVIPSGKCYECFYYPRCIKLKKCEADTGCSEGKRLLIKYNIEEMMRQFYEKSKARKINTYSRA